MLVARYENQQLIIADAKVLYPEWCFNEAGPEDSWYEQTGCFPVSRIRDYDPSTQILQGSEPYLENGVVYTVVVADKPETPPEIIDNTTPGL